MRTETLWEIYKAVVGSKIKQTRSEIADTSGYSQGTVNNAVTVLRRAGLIKEHYIEKQSRFGTTGTEFLVLDMTCGNEYRAYLYSESLCEKEIKRFTPNQDFPIHDNIRSFVSEAENAAKKSNVVSVCLIINEKYNKFCADVIPEYVAKAKMTRDRAALRMREKYFNVKLEDYFKRT